MSAFVVVLFGGGLLGLGHVSLLVLFGAMRLVSSGATEHVRRVAAFGTAGACLLRSLGDVATLGFGALLMVACELLPGPGDPLTMGLMTGLMCSPLVAVAWHLPRH